MELKFSNSGTPFIQLNNGMFIFSKATSHPDKGYKFICYSGTETTTTCVSSARAKFKRYAKVVEDINFTLRVSDFRRNDKKSFPTKVKVLSKISLNFIKNLVMSNVKDNYLPFTAIPFLMEQINKEDETDTWDDDPDIDDEDDEDDELEPIQKKKLRKGNGLRKKPLKIKRKLSFSKVKPLK